MKHLKTYKIFESNDNSLLVKDIHGFNVQFRASVTKGILIAIGGAESKGSKVDIDNSILSEVIKVSRFGKDSNIIIIPTASSYQNEIDSEYRTTFERIGCKNIKTLFISSKDGVDSVDNLDLLNNSNIVMFSGGDQSRISEFFLGTKFLSSLKNKLNSEHFVVAGTSAGAMCMSENMITGGKEKVKCGLGLSLVPELIIDTHFIERDRLNRLVEAISIYPNRIGVGLAEDTAIIINNGKFRIIGSGSVTIFDSNNLENNLKLNVLSSGDTFNIQQMKHLKTYTLYERVSEETKIFESNDNFLLDCQDIFLELKDNWFDVQFRTGFVDSYINHDGPDDDDLICVLAEINITKRDESKNNIYTFGEISETILRLNDFLKLNNKRATAYESTIYSELDDIIKTWGEDFRMRRLTIYLRK